jgi:hypothetical protein
VALYAKAPQPAVVSFSDVVVEENFLIGLYFLDLFCLFKFLILLF